MDTKHTDKLLQIMENMINFTRHFIQITKTIQVSELATERAHHFSISKMRKMMNISKFNFIYFIPMTEKEWKTTF